MRIEFTKMSGAGNDFIVVDNRDGHIKNGVSLAQQLCDRRWGVGADGLLLLELSTTADYRMMYFNSDGSFGGMCGNGGRCIAYYAYKQKIAADRHYFDALDFQYRAEVRRNTVALHMKNPTSFRKDVVLQVSRRKIRGHFIDTGSPHFVIHAKAVRPGRATLEKIDIESLGRAIRHHKLFLPGGTNVNFIELAEPNTVRLRTYERGVEAETLACGTGSIAAAVVGHLVWNLTPPISVMPKSGVSLEIDFKHGGDGVRSVTLSGPAKIVFTGTIEV